MGTETVTCRLDELTLSMLGFPDDGPDDVYLVSAVEVAIREAARVAWAAGFEAGRAAAVEQRGPQPAAAWVCTSSCPHNAEEIFEAGRASGRAEHDQFRAATHRET